MKTIALIIGHSTTDPGAINPNTGHTEYDYNSGLVVMISNRLAGGGLVRPIIVHRDTYLDLPRQVNATGADVALEFHCNAFNAKASGTEMLYWHASGKGKGVAQQMQDAAYTVLALPYRGVKPISGNDRGGYLLRKTVMPCVIVESFFIDNDKDLRVGLNNQLQLASAYANAIEGMLS